jgi:hypothetical protein
VWDVGEGVLVVTGRSWDGSVVTVDVVVRNLSAGEWAVFVGGECVESRNVEGKGSFEVAVEFGGNEVDVVFKPDM